MDIPGTFNRNAVAPLDALEVIQRVMNIEWPQDYIVFLQLADGGEGFINNDYLILYSSEKLVEYNRDFGFTKFLPSSLLIGSDGGGQGVVFDYRQTPPTLCLIPFETLSWDDKTSISGTIQEVMNDGFKRED